MSFWGDTKIEIEEHDGILRECRYIAFYDTGTTYHTSDEIENLKRSMEPTRYILVEVSQTLGDAACR